MKCLIVSDIHYALKQYDWVTQISEKFDLVIIAGDLLDLASIVDRDVQAVVALKYFSRIEQKTRLMVSSGNHDTKETFEDGEQTALWLQGGRSKATAVDGDSVVIDDMLITVCPWWDGEQGKEKVRQLIEADSKKDKKSWVWVYHSPPNEAPVSWTGQAHFGDDQLNEWIRQYRPHMVFCGHVHQSPFRNGGNWIHVEGGTFTFNAGKQLGPIPAFLVWDTDSNQVTWVSQAGTERVKLETPIEKEVLA